MKFTDKELALIIEAVRKIGSGGRCSRADLLIVATAEDKLLMEQDRRKAKKAAVIEDVKE